MRRNKNQQGINKIIDEPEIELKKDSFTIWDYLHAFFWVVLIVTLVVPVYAAITNPPSRSLTTWLLMAYIVLDLIITIAYLILTIPTDKRIISKLNRMGYYCRMNEGQMVFRRREYNWSIATFKVKTRYRRIIFSIGFTEDILDRDHALTNKLFCYMGSRHPSTVLVWNGKDTYHCFVETVLTSTKDIEREFNTAMEKIDNTLGELSYVFEQAFVQQSTVPEHKIGFHVSDSETSDEISENVHQVAAETNVSTQ